MDTMLRKSEYRGHTIYHNLRTGLVWVVKGGKTLIHTNLISAAQEDIDLLESKNATTSVESSARPEDKSRRPDYRPAGRSLPDRVPHTPLLRRDFATPSHSTRSVVRAIATCWLIAVPGIVVLYAVANALLSWVHRWPWETGIGLALTALALLLVMEEEPS